MSFTNLPSAGASVWRETVATSTDLPATAETGAVRLTLDTDVLYEFNGATWQAITTGSGSAGDVVGPGSSTDNAAVRFDATTGKLIQNSAVIIDDSNNVTGVVGLTATTLTGSTSATSPIMQGSVASGGTLTVKSTSHATKGKVLVGTSAYDEVNNRLGVGTASPSYPFDVQNGRVNVGNLSNNDIFLSARVGGSEISFSQFAGVKLDVNTSGAFLQLFDDVAASTSVQVLARSSRHLVLGVDGTSTTKSVKVRGCTSQSTKLLIVELQDLTEKFSVDISGNVVIAGAISAASSSTMAAVVKGAASRSVALLQLQTSAGASLGTPGGTISSQFANGSSTSTDGTFDTIYTDTIAANTLAINGDGLRAEYTVSLVSSATATRQLRVLFGGITIFDSAALTYVAAGTAKIRVEIVRVTSTTCRSTVDFFPAGSSAILAFAQVTYTSDATLTGMTLTGTNVLILQGAATSTGAASADIVGRMSRVVTQMAP